MLPGIEMLQVPQVLTPHMHKLKLLTLVALLLTLIYINLLLVTIDTWEISDLVLSHKISLLKLVNSLLLKVNFLLPLLVLKLSVQVVQPSTILVDLLMIQFGIL